MLTIKHAAHVMARQGHGSIVAISSVAGATTHRWFGAYGPAKAGLEMLCMVAADELGASGVRVNTVRPGLTNTDLVEAITAPGPSHATTTSTACRWPAWASPRTWPASCGSSSVPRPRGSRARTSASTAGHALRRGPDLSGLLEGVFGADGLRGVVPES